MSEKGLQISSNLIDSYLIQVVHVLQRCQEVVYRITRRHLKIQRILIFPRKYLEHWAFYDFVRIRPCIQFEKHPILDPSTDTNTEPLELVYYFRVYADKLRDVILKELKADEEMKKEDSTLSTKIEKLTILKKALDEFTGLLDTIVIFYSDTFLGIHPKVNLPSVDSVKQLKEQLDRLKSQLEINELSSFFASHDAESNISNAVIISTILGLTDDYGDYLGQLDEELLMHHSMKYYLEAEIESRGWKMEEDGILHQSGKTILAENLKSMGFNEETAKRITELIPNEFVDLQKPAFWAQRYLKHVWQYHPLLSDSPRNLDIHHPVDKWLEIKLPPNSSERQDFEVAKFGLNEVRRYFAAHYGPSELRDSKSAVLRLTKTENSDGANLCAVKMIFISSDESQGNVLVEEYLNELKNDDSCIFFHGTTHEDAISILTKGIIPTRGSKRQDFSSGDGFYLSDTFENAKAWSQAGRGGNHAVVVYNVKRNFLHSGESNGLDLSDNHSRWEEVVRFCRIGYTNVTG